MSILYRGNRPIIAFDVGNTDHRRWYAEFVKYRTWGRCPVRFLAESLDQDLVTYIEHKMLVYYVNKEFENVKNKNKTKTSKPRSKSTSGTVSKRQSVQAKDSGVKTKVSA